MKERLYIATFSDNATEKIKEYGLGIEINQTCISENLDAENSQKLVASIRADIFKSASNRVIFHGPFTEIHPAAIDHRAREAAMIRLEEAYEIAKQFECKKMVVHTGWLPFIYFKSWQAEKGAVFWQTFMKNKPEDFFLCIENVLEDEPYMLADMMKQIHDPRIGLCLDIGHANAATTDDVSTEEWIKTLSPYITHFHLHNNYGNNDSHSTFDEGTMDMRRILNLIDELCSKDVTLTIEATDCSSCIKWLENNKYL